MVYIDTYQANIPIAKILGWWEPKINSNGNIFHSRVPISLLYVDPEVVFLTKKKEMEAETRSFKKILFDHINSCTDLNVQKEKTMNSFNLQSPKQDKTVYIEPNCI